MFTSLGLRGQFSNKVEISYEFEFSETLSVTST